MSKSKHHYVPRFYLKHFASQPRRINVHHLRSRDSFREVGLKDQCYRIKLYGKTDEAEDLFQQVEAVAAPVIRTVVETSLAPRSGSSEHRVLLDFICLQMLRTTSAAREVYDSLDKMLNLVEDGYPGREIDPAWKRPSDFEAMVLSLSNYGLAFKLMDDLGIHTVINKSNFPLITSDNPAFKYNQYCEGARGRGALGFAKRGLQVFLPLSPRHLVVLYDREVYRVGHQGSPATEIRDADDVLALNTLQALNAEECLYFSDWNVEGMVRAVAQGARKHRGDMETFVQELVADRIGEPPIIHSYERRPNLCIRLSFMSVKREARRVKLSARTALRRRSDEEIDRILERPPKPRRRAPARIERIIYRPKGGRPPK